MPMAAGAEHPEHTDTKSEDVFRIKNNNNHITKVITIRSATGSVQLQRLLRGGHQDMHATRKNQVILPLDRHDRYIGSTSSCVLVRARKVMLITKHMQKAKHGSRHAQASGRISVPLSRHPGMQRVRLRLPERETDMRVCISTYYSSCSSIVAPKAMQDA